MSDAAIALEMAAPPEVDAVAKMSAGQLDVFWDKQQADAAWNAKLVSGDGNARKILDAYMVRKDQLKKRRDLSLMPPKTRMCRCCRTAGCSATA